MICLLQRIKVNEIYHDLGKASCMVYTEAQLLLPKGIKICLNPLRFTVFRETNVMFGPGGLLGDVAQVRLPSLA